MFEPNVIKKNGTDQSPAPSFLICKIRERDNVDVEDTDFIDLFM